MSVISGEDLFAPGLRVNMIVTLQAQWRRDGVPVAGVMA